MAKKDFRQNPVVNFFTKQSEIVSAETHVQDVRTNKNEQEHVQIARTNDIEQMHVQNVRTEKPNQTHVQNARTKEAKEKHVQDVRTNQETHVQKARTNDKNKTHVQSARTYKSKRQKEIKSERLTLRIRPSLKSKVISKTEFLGLSINEIIDDFLTDFVSE